MMQKMVMIAYLLAVSMFSYAAEISEDMHFKLVITNPKPVLQGGGTRDKHDFIKQQKRKISCSWSGYPCMGIAAHHF